MTDRLIFRWLLGPDMVLPLYHAVIEYVTENSSPAVTADSCMREREEEKPLTPESSRDAPPGSATASSFGAILPLPASLSGSPSRLSASHGARPPSPDSEPPATHECGKTSCLVHHAEGNDREYFGSFLEILK